MHPWTLQDDILQFTKQTVDEYLVYFNRGVQGIFVEFPDTAKALIHKHYEKVSEIFKPKAFNDVTSLRRQKMLLVY